MENVLDAFGQRCKHSKKTIQNCVILLITYGLEEFIRTQLFRCPCSNFFMYSVVVTVGPTLFLLGVSVMISGSFWKSFMETGKRQHCKERCNYRMKSLTSLLQPLLAPTAYVTIVFLQGEFFVCSRNGGPHVVCYSQVEDADLFQESNEKNILKAQAQSQILGFGILVAAIVFSLGLVCIRRCCFDDNTLPNINELKDLETNIVKELFLEKLKMVVQEDAKKRIDDVFQKKTSSDVEEALQKARQVLAAIDYHDSRKARYNRLGDEDDETELRLMDSTHL